MLLADPRQEGQCTRSLVGLHANEQNCLLICKKARKNASSVPLPPFGKRLLQKLGLRNALGSGGDLEITLELSRDTEVESYRLSRLRLDEVMASVCALRRFSLWLGTAGRGRGRRRHAQATSRFCLAPTRSIILCASRSAFSLSVGKVTSDAALPSSLARR